jgi:Glycosyl hydrolase family 63 C-terminal domain
MQWFIDNHPDVVNHIEVAEVAGKGTRRLLSLVNREQLGSVARYLLDESEFFSPYGIRAISRFHKGSPYVMSVNGNDHRVDYEPAESSTGLFGGNSNWRGPIWFPINFLLIESLQKFHYFYGDGLSVELPTGSGRRASLWDAAAEISRRLTRIFLRAEDGRRPVFGGLHKFQTEPGWGDHIYFHEYFHGDNGAGIGASHQTGWTGLVAKLIEQSGRGM